MRFLIAFLILLTAREPQAVGWALLLCLWKIYDKLGDIADACCAGKNERGEK